MPVITWCITGTRCLCIYSDALAVAVPARGAALALGVLSRIVENNWLLYCLQLRRNGLHCGEPA